MKAEEEESIQSWSPEGKPCQYHMLYPVDIGWKNPLYPMDIRNIQGGTTNGYPQNNRHEYIHIQGT